MSLDSIVAAYRKTASEGPFTPILGYQRGSADEGGAQFKTNGPVGKGMMNLLRNQSKIPRAAGAGLATGAAMLMPAMVQAYRESKNAPTNLGPITPDELAGSKMRIDAARGDVPPEASAPKPQVGTAPISKAPEAEPWAKKNVGVSTGSNVGDAALGGGAALAGLYGAYQLLKKKQPEE